MTATIIPLTEMKRLLDSGMSPKILDVRTPPEYARLHATGARLIPLDQLDPAAVAAEQASDHQPIYVICQSGSRAAKACDRLHDAGAAEVYNVEGGTTAWERAGLPVVRGSSGVMSLERQVRIMAGSLVLVGVILSLTVNHWFIGLSAFIGAGLVFAGLTDTCGMGMLLAKMPWNRA